MPYMGLFVPKLDKHAPCFAISEKAYCNKILPLTSCPVRFANVL